MPASHPVFDAAALRAARLRAGLTQAELARLIGVAGGERVSQWERGQAQVRNPARLHALADALDIPAAALLEIPSAGRSLRWLRLVAGLTLDQLAAAVNVSVPTIKRWEAHGAARGLSEASLAGLAEALGVTADGVADALRH